MGSSGKAKLQAHGTLCHALPGFLTEQLDLGPRGYRGSSDLINTGENPATTYCYSSTSDILCL